VSGAGPSHESLTQAADRPVDPLARGRGLFGKQCAICHGANGDGQGKFAYLMSPRPRDFTRGKFKLTTTESAIPSEEDLVRTITRGMPGSAMPPWGHLPSSDLQALGRFVRSVFVDAVSAELDRGVSDGLMTRDAADQLLAARTQPGSPLRVPPEPPFDDLRWFRGRRVYLEACATCHGQDGEPVASAVKFDDEGYPVPPRSFVRGIYKGGGEGHQLYARIVKGLPGTPMPSYEGAYSDDEVWDLIHYVQSLSQAGSQKRAQLAQGTFVAPRLQGPLPSGPMDAAWQQARPLYVALTPLWWDEQRIEGLTAQALHNGQELALRFSWIDPSVDDSAVKTSEFRDAVAVQFSLSPDPPFYMGDATQHGGVNIWMWKADRQTNLAKGYQDVDAAFPDGVADQYPESAFKFEQMGEEQRGRLLTQHDPMFITAWGAGNLVASPLLKTPVECLVAQGPGTLMGKPINVQVVQGSAVYERGVWYVQMQRSMELPPEHAHEGEADERVFRPGDYLPVSFAIWNGAAGDRDGKKNISIWQKLVIE
jgi:DMSO reductase family type II enzyme heme b subunit